MNEKLLKDLEELAASIKQNAPEVEKAIASSSGHHPDDAVVMSVSKYHSALTRLAGE